MGEYISVDPAAAAELVVVLRQAAARLEGDRLALAPPVADAAAMLGWPTGALARMGEVADWARFAADDLAWRLDLLVGTEGTSFGGRLIGSVPWRTLATVDTDLLVARLSSAAVDEASAPELAALLVELDARTHDDPTTANAIATDLGVANVTRYLSATIALAHLAALSRDRDGSDLDGLSRADAATPQPVLRDPMRHLGAPLARLLTTALAADPHGPLAAALLGDPADATTAHVATLALLLALGTPTAPWLRTAAAWLSAVDPALVQAMREQASLVGNAMDHVPLLHPAPDPILALLRALAASPDTASGVGAPTALLTAALATGPAPGTDPAQFDAAIADYLLAWFTQLAPDELWTALQTGLLPWLAETAPSLGPAAAMVLLGVLGGHWLHVLGGRLPATMQLELPATATSTVFDPATLVQVVRLLAGDEDARALFVASIGVALQTLLAAAVAAYEAEPDPALAAELLHAHLRPITDLLDVLFEVVAADDAAPDLALALLASLAQAPNAIPNPVTATLGLAITSFLLTAWSTRPTGNAAIASYEQLVSGVPFDDDAVAASTTPSAATIAPVAALDVAIVNAILANTATPPPLPAVLGQDGQLYSPLEVPDPIAFAAAYHQWHAANLEVLSLEATIANIIVPLLEGAADH